MSANQDWAALSADWRSQESPGIDVEALRAEATRRGRTLRRVLALEIVFSALVAVMCAYIALQPRADGFERWLFGGLGVFVVVYQAYMVWLRRREWSEAGLDASALLEVELRRCATTLHYWRLGMWLSLAIWVGLFGLWLYALQAGWPDQRVGGLMGGLLANVVLLPALGVYGLWRSRQARARCQRLRALRELLGAA